MDTIVLSSAITTATNIFTATDATDYSAITYFLDSQSVLKLEGPLATLYNNTSFASPDFNYPGTLSKNTTIPLISGVIPQGAYTLTTTTRVYKELVPILSVTVATQSILVPLILAGNFIPSQAVTWTGGANAGALVVSSATTGPAGVTVVFTGGLTSPSTTGTLSFFELVTTVSAYTYCYEAPTALPTLTANCATATLAEGNDTNYAITCEGQSILPSTTANVFTLNAPTNSGGSPVYAQTVSAVPVTTTELWTQTWTLTLVSTLSYTLPSGLVVNTVITGSKSLDVNCDATLCCMSTCIQNATNTWISAQSLGPNAILAAAIAQMNIQSAFMLYSIGVSCGDTTLITTAVARMETYIANTDCCNGCSDTGVSTQVVALYDVNVNGNTVVVQSGDVYIDISTAVVGDTTTYTLTLDTAAVEALIAAYLAANTSIITDIVDDMHLQTHLSSYAAAIDVAVSLDGALTTGSAIIVAPSYAAGIVADDISIGEPIYHSSFPIGTYILSIAPGGDITVSSNSTTTGAATGILLAAKKFGIGASKYKRTVSGLTSYNWVVTNPVQNSLQHDSITGATQLIGDTLSPGNLKFYSTDYGGTRVWQSIASELVENAGSNCLADADTDFTLKTIGATTIGTYLINLSAQVTVTTLGLEPTSFTVSIFKNGSIINTRAVYNCSKQPDFYTVMSVGIDTLETLIDTDVVKIRVTTVNGAVTISNISATFVRIS